MKKTAKDFGFEVELVASGDATQTTCVPKPSCGPDTCPVCGPKADG